MIGQMPRHSDAYGDQVQGHLNRPSSLETAVVAAYVRSRGDRRCLSRAHYGRSVEFFTSIRAIASSARRGAISSAIIELDATDPMCGCSGPIIEAINSAVPVALRVNVTPASIRHLLELANTSSQVFVSLMQLEAADIALERLLNEPRARGAQFRILARFAPDVAPSVVPIVVNAVLASSRRLGVRELASLCRMAVRTLEWRLACADLPAARTLLGILTSLHAVWLLDMLGWSSKRTAHVVAFHSTSSFAAFVHRHTGHRPSELCQLGGFDALLKVGAERLSAETRIGSAGN